MYLRRLSATLALFLTISMALATVPAQTSKATNKGGIASIQAEDMQQWLTYLSSDELEGRNTFSEGLGLAAAYIAEHLRDWGVKPGGDNGSYFQRVKVLGVKSTNRSSVTVEVNGQSKTFKNGEGITWPTNVGGKRTFSVDQVEFLGYGLNIPQANINDYEGKDVKGKAVVYLGQGPKGLDPQSTRRAIGGRARFATDQMGALASIGQTLARRGGPGGGGGQGQGGQGGGQGANGGGQGGGRNQLPQPDFTTVQRLDSPTPPAVNGQDEFFDFLFSGADTKYADLKAKAEAQEPLPRFALKGVKLTFNVDADYEVVQTQYTRNVIGIVEGSDAKLKDTYVAFGAHYDHVGYAQGEVVQGPNGPRLMGAPGAVTAGAEQDRIWNGADDDGSGTTTLLAVCRAFALGQRPKRSLLFVWHAGEERGLWGSRYYADYPTIPIDKISAQINMDMVGRNRDNKPEEANTVYIVGSDRISTELHNINVDANASLTKPLKLDYEMNDPTDPEQVYYRSDHYSYAAKGIPIVYLTTGLHQDYHHNTDSVEKIQFDKMARIGQLVYATGWRVAQLDHYPARDNKGPRFGKGSSGKITG
ncbi:MAG TPA: M28 family peptidase [Blastocatellia bacterium]|nr:M28 family peptidase [Blastocatellia bacterium]